MLLCSSRTQGWPLGSVADAVGASKQHLSTIRNCAPRHSGDTGADAR